MVGDAVIHTAAKLNGQATVVAIVISQHIVHLSVSLTGRVPPLCSPGPRPAAYPEARTALTGVSRSEYAIRFD